MSTRVCELTKYQGPVPLRTLATATTEAGQFPETVAYAERVRKLAGAGQRALIDQMSAVIEAFRAGRPYHTG